MVRLRTKEYILDFENPSNGGGKLETFSSNIAVLRPILKRIPVWNPSIVFIA